MSQRVWGDLESGEKFGAGAASQGVMSKSRSSSEEPDIFRLQGGETERQKREEAIAEEKGKDHFKQMKKKDQEQGVT